eukprot:13943387-Alexandrium_andersonii.AAC.1
MAAPAEAISQPSPASSFVLQTANVISLGAHRVAPLCAWARSAHLTLIQETHLSEKGQLDVSAEIRSL